MNARKKIRLRRSSYKKPAPSPIHFPIVFCINLQRRADRWERFLANLPADWPFAPPVRFPAIDGCFCESPPWWKQGHGAWGCYRSHLRVVEESLNAGFNSILVFEDDALFSKEFSNNVIRFLSHVPYDWDMLYFGGQLLKCHLSPPKPVNECVFRAHNVNRCHAYAINGKALPKLYQHLISQSWLDGYHVDHHLGLLHETGKLNIYVPENWLVGQREDKSDITFSKTANEFWLNPVDASVIEKASLVLVVSDYNTSCHLPTMVLKDLGVWFRDSPESDGITATHVADVFDKLASLKPILYNPDQLYSAEMLTRVTDAMGDLVWKASEKQAVAGVSNPIAFLFMPLLKQIFGDRLKVVRFKSAKPNHFDSYKYLQVSDTSAIAARLYIECEHAMQHTPHFVLLEETLGSGMLQAKDELRRYLDIRVHAHGVGDNLHTR